MRRVDYDEDCEDKSRNLFREFMVPLLAVGTITFVLGIVTGTKAYDHFVRRKATREITNQAHRLVGEASRLENLGKTNEARGYHTGVEALEAVDLIVNPDRFPEHYTNKFQ